MFSLTYIPCQAFLCSSFATKGCTYIYNEKFSDQNMSQGDTGDGLRCILLRCLMGIRSSIFFIFFFSCPPKNVPNKTYVDCGSPFIISVYTVSLFQIVIRQKAAYSQLVEHSHRMGETWLSIMVSSSCCVILLCLVRQQFSHFLFM